MKTEPDTVEQVAHALAKKLAKRLKKAHRLLKRWTLVDELSSSAARQEETDTLTFRSLRLLSKDGDL